MKATSAIPIISAAAVAAVLPGLRTVFPLASFPAAPPIRRAGRPTRAAIGRTSRDESIAMPTNRSRTPPARPIRRSVVPRSSVNIARASRSSAPTTTRPAIHGTNGEIREGGSVAPSRTAAIGGTRVARMAGKSPAASVTRTPTSIDTMTVRSAKTRSAVGSSKPNVPKSAWIPSARRRPKARPKSDATMPMTSDSRMTEASTCRRDAPIVRKVANSRVRCATVIEKVLKMTNAPTKSAMPANVSRK